MSSLYVLQALTLLVPLVLLPVLARRLGPDVFGVYAMQLSLGAVLLVLLDYGFGVGATRAAAAVRDDRALLSRVVSDVVGARALLSVLVVAIWALVWFALPIAREQPAAYWLALILTLLQGASVAWVYQALGRLPIAFGIELAMRVASTVAVILVVTGPDRLAFVPAIQAVGVLATLAITAILLRRRVDALLPTTRRSFRILRSNGLTAGIRFVQAAPSLGNTALLGALAPAGTAVYGPAERASNAVRSLLLPVSQVAFPELVVLARSDTPRARRYLRSALFVLVAAAVVGAALLVAVADPIVTLLFGPGYHESATVLRILCLALPAFAVLQVLGSQWMLVHHLDRAFLVCVSIGLVLNVGLALVFVPGHGPEALAWALLIGEYAAAVSTIAAVEFGRRHDLRVLRRVPVA